MLDKLRSLIASIRGGASSGVRGLRGSSSFLPEEYVRTRTERRANLIGLTLFGVVMLCVVGAFFVTNHRWLSVREQRDVIDALYKQQTQRIEQLKELEAQREEMIAKAGITTSLVERVPRSVLLAAFSRPMPEEMTLLELEVESIKAEKPKIEATKKGQDEKGVRSISVKSKKKSKKSKDDKKEEAKPLPEPDRYRHTVRLVGVAPTNDLIAEYLDRLDASGLFESMELGFIKFAKVDGIELRRFEIVCLVSEDTDARAYFETDEGLALAGFSGDRSGELPVVDGDGDVGQQGDLGEKFGSMLEGWFRERVGDSMTGLGGDVDKDSFANVRGSVEEGER